MERLDTGLIAAQFRRSTSHRSRDARAAAVVEQLLSENSQADPQLRTGCKGVTLTKQAFQKLNQALERQAGIEKWSVIIRPQLSGSAP